MFDIGVDIEDIGRFKKYSKNSLSSSKMPEEDLFFLKTIFSDKELKYCFSKGRPAEHLTARFCAKEAFIKAISSLDVEIKHSEIEILNNESGKPEVRLPDGFEQFVVKISLSHEKEKAIAFVMVEGKL